MYKKLLLALAFVLPAFSAHAAFTDCVIGTDSSAQFGDANFGTLNPQALPSGPITTTFTYLGRCTRTSTSDYRRVQFAIDVSSMSTNPGLTVSSDYSTVLITLDWNSNETGTKEVTGTATFTLNGMSSTTAPGSRTFQQLTSTRARACERNNTSNCTSYGTSRDEYTYVYANVVKSCTISAATLNFGNIQPSSTSNTDANSTTAVSCTNTTPYSVTFSGGAASSSGVRNMSRSSGTDKLNYQVYSNSGRTTALTGSTSLSATGTGSSQSFSLYGRVFSGQFPQAGSYTDTLTMTLAY